MNKLEKRLILIFMTVILVLIGMSTAIKAADTQFSLTETQLNVPLNSTRFLSYENKPSGEIVTWSSTDETIATVENGTITGLKIGTTTITATAGQQSASCQVSVVYSDLTIGANSSNNVRSVNLVLEEHPSENLIANVLDGDFEKVQSAEITWRSDEESVATVDNNGKVTAVSVGTTTITAEAAGVSDTCEINVVAAPKFTDFSNAKYELLFDLDVDLKITDIIPKEENNYYYIITSNNIKPTISATLYGALDTGATAGVDGLICNIDENYMYDRNLDKYVELNQDLYLWIIEEVDLDASYTENGENYISHSTKFVVEGQKLTRPQLPQLNLILKSLSIWGGENGSKEEQFSSISFRFPSATENRKFKLKIGKVTDNSILQKIQNNDYSGITALLQYAKNNQAIYTADLTTTSENYYRNDQALFDGIKILEDTAYYYIYVEFDDENGKYYPIEGVTLGQAWISSSNKYWDLYAYTTDNFEWNNLSSTAPDDNKKVDNTIAKDNLPNTGTTTIVIISILALTGTMVYLKLKNDKYKEI